MSDRQFFIEYKGYKIECWQGSNWVYIEKRPFISLKSAKNWITNKIKIDEFNKGLK